MRRTFGFLLVLLGLAHAGFGLWPRGAAPTWVVTLIWWLAMTGFVAAGAGLIGFPWFDRQWRVIASVASVASLSLIAMSPLPVLMVGAAIDGAILLDAFPFVHSVVARQLHISEHPVRRPIGAFGGIVALLLRRT